MCRSAITRLGRAFTPCSHHCDCNARRAVASRRHNYSEYVSELLRFSRLTLLSSVSRFDILLVAYYSDTKSVYSRCRTRLHVWGAYALIDMPSRYLPISTDPTMTGRGGHNLCHLVPASILAYSYVLDSHALRSAD